MKTLVGYCISNIHIFAKPKPGEFKNEDQAKEIYETMTFMKVADYRSKFKLTIEDELVPETTALYEQCKATLT